jgi:hypothetical protein
MKKIIIGIAVLVILCIPVLQSISLYNQYHLIVNKFNQKMDERSAFYDKMWKTISQKGKVAVKNDSSFTRNINLIMQGRKDAEGLMMKWVQESNPNVNFQEVSALYKDLSRTIEAEREGFFIQEKYLQDIKLQCDNLLAVFPGGWILRTFFGAEYIKYKPITSDRTDDAVRTGKDNDVSVF